MSIIFRLLIVVLVVSSTSNPAISQPIAANGKAIVAPKPFRILTSGKQITIKSPKTISHVMVWTSGGHRVLEQRNINSGNFSFEITINQKIYFIMIRLADGSNYTEKISI